MRRLPPLAAIRAFEAAARTENFTAAAAELGMTQAAVSYQVKSLEERMGAPLFVREKGRVRLTAARGARLLPPLSSAFDSIEAAFASHREEDESLLTVTTTHTFANTWLAWRLGAFQMEHPDLAVRMTTSNEVCDLRAGDADVAIRAGGGGWEGLEHHRLFEVQLHADGEPGLHRGGRAQAWTQARAERPSQPEPASSRATTGGSNGSRDNGVPADECVLAAAPESASITRPNEGHAAMAGQGFALLTPLLWKGDVAAGRLPCRSPTGYRPGVGLIGWSIRPIGG